MKDKDGNLIGFEVEVAKRLGSDMGIEVEFIQTKWSELIPSLIRKKFDVIIGGMSIRESRKKLINFTIPYDYQGDFIVANRKLSFSYDKLDDFNQSGVTIAVKSGSKSEDICKKFFPNAHIRRFEGFPQMFNVLISGGAHAGVVNESLATFQAIKNPGNLFTPISEPLDPEPVGMGVRKEDQALLNFLNYWIAKSETEKWLNSRHQYWFKTRDWEVLLSKSN
jgi:polar amino acid transport system substrate-binding protein